MVQLRGPIAASVSRVPVTCAVALGTRSRLWGRKEKREEKKLMGEAERRIGGMSPDTIYDHF